MANALEQNLSLRSSTLRIMQSQQLTIVVGSQLPQVRANLSPVELVPPETREEMQQRSGSWRKVFRE
ncbi:hypothetical protein JF535_05445 [Microbulbifer salipaludis]|uniref:Uncharacterized protein n=1 Tax=Microbulbifer salipaludis TaxID=187980 RepID=A0ABS3E4R4_9GAMM|nr:hypothetical protein [Microbulbifer salipaludis]MBN8430297.1 hypothetical protein [Microbulbifer salipaludis]